ncbi:MAG TPA: hypothetical protein VM536_08095, partial [Chloroflexia bacterium]|nr:hypothetical protein [Chloroflexia bacterium]
GFLQAVATHPAVQVIIGKSGDLLEVRGAGGTAFVRPEPHGKSVDHTAAPAQSVIERVQGENPFAGFEEPEIAARQVAAFATMDGCGDVICLAALFTPQTLHDATPGAVGRQHVYTFENQLGTHASIGGDQSYPFLMLPARVAFDGDAIVTASQMYPVLKGFTRGDFDSNVRG